MFHEQQYVTSLVPQSRMHVFPYPLPSMNQVVLVWLCFVLRGSKACLTQAPLRWPCSVHINQQVVAEALAPVSSLISVSARVKVYEFHPGATPREAGRPSDSSHDGWPLWYVWSDAQRPETKAAVNFRFTRGATATFASLVPHLAVWNQL